MVATPQHRLRVQDVLRHLCGLSRAGGALDDGHLEAGTRGTKGTHPTTWAKSSEFENDGGNWNFVKTPNFDVCNINFPQNGSKWVEMGRHHVDIPIHPAPSFGTWFSATVSIISFQHHHGSLMISAKPNNVLRRNSATKKRVCCELYKPIKSSLDWSSRHPMRWGLNQSHINAGIAQFQMMQHCFGWKNGSSCPCFAFYCPPCPPPLQREMSSQSSKVFGNFGNKTSPGHALNCSCFITMAIHGRAGYGFTSGCVVDLILPWSNGASVAQKIYGKLRCIYEFVG